MTVQLRQKRIDASSTGGRTSSSGVMPVSRGGLVRERLGDDRIADLKFLSQWLRSPRRTGAIAASSPALSRAMVQPLSPERPGPVVEFGPGTGPVTRALIDRGFDPDRLILIETNRKFGAHLKTAFPGVRVLDDDAFRIAELVSELEIGPLNAVVSSLPLLNWPQDRRCRLLADVLSVLPAGQPFVQFTYSPSAPIPFDRARVVVSKSPRVWLNLPPATVWTYRAR